MRGAPWNSLRAGALRSDNHGESDHEACARRRPCHPANAPPQAQPEGGGERTSQHPHGPLLRSAQSAQRVALAPGRLRPSEAMARMDVRFRVPFRMRRGAQRPADQGSRLSERRRREFERDPAGREHRRLPAAKRRDAACRVAFLLGTFLWRSKETYLARRGETRPPPSTRERTTTSTRLRKARTVGKTAKLSSVRLI